MNIVHGYLFSEESKTPKAKMILLAERFLGKKTDVILTMNAEDTRLAKKYRLTEGKIVQIPGMGAKLRPQITPPEEIRLPFSPDSYLLVFVGELSKRKNQKLLIEALHIIKKDIPSARLCLVGDGGEREALRSLAVRLGISDSVYFVGKRRDACDFIRAADLYVTASISEGLPFNVIEALGAGKTVVASRVKGHTDLVEDGASGFLFDVKNADAMAALVIKIHREGLRLDGKEIKKQYEKYKKENVFLKVYREIKNAIKA